MARIVSVFLAVAAVCAVLAPAAAALTRRNHIGALNVGLVKRFGAFRNETEDRLGELYFNQTLDHFDRADGRTWQQRYFVNNSVYQTGGPVFFILGGEGPVSANYINGHFIVNQYAEQNHAMIVALEHRFYGNSIPTADSSTANLRYLSSEQALADAAVFAQFIQDSYRLPVGTKWITFGGSYSGCLSAWARYKYPSVFNGAYATSGPVNAQLDFTQYLQVVQDSVGATCAARLQTAAEGVEAMLSTNSGISKLESVFETCSPVETPNDAMMLRSAFIGVVSGIVQYNNDNNNYQPFNLTKMCSILESGDDPVAALATLNNLVNIFEGANCTEVNYTDYIGQMQSTSDGRSWTYQTCTEFGFFQTTDGTNQPFFNQPLSFYTQMCTDMFQDALMPDTDWTNVNYGGLEIPATNTFLPNGDVDPWHALGINNDNDIGKGSAWILIEGTAHCADLYPPRSSDLPSLVSARALASTLLNEWIAGN